MRIFNKFRGTRGWLSLWERVIRFRDMISQQAQRRAKILTFWSKYGDEAAREAFGVSRRTLYRWQQKLRQAGGELEGLNVRSTAPRRRRRRVIPPAITERLILLRTAYPRLGKEKLHALLKLEGYPESVSTLGRLLIDLKRQGRLPDPKRLSFYARSGRLVERQDKPRQKKLRRPKGCRVLEVDTMVRFIDGVKRYILTGVDTEKRTAFATAYTNHGSGSAADFLQRAREALPDCPATVQTDNGSEFAGHFEVALASLGLTRFHTYPRSPQLNAHIERFNRTLDEEFLRYHRTLLRDDIRTFNEKLIDWLLWYNAERPHHALGLRSPLQYIVSTLPVSECQMWWTNTRI